MEAEENETMPGLRPFLSDSFDELQFPLHAVILQANNVGLAGLLNDGFTSVDTFHKNASPLHLAAAYGNKIAVNLLIRNRIYNPKK